MLGRWSYCMSLLPVWKYSSTSVSYDNVFWIWILVLEQTTSQLSPSSGSLLRLHVVSGTEQWVCTSSSHINSVYPRPAVQRDRAACFQFVWTGEMNQREVSQRGITERKRGCFSKNHHTVHERYTLTHSHTHTTHTHILSLSHSHPPFTEWEKIGNTELE